MSRQPIHSKGQRTAIALLFATMTIAMVATVMAAADHPADENRLTGGSGLSQWTGDWEVLAGDDLEYANQMIDLDGNLSVDMGGRLVLRNVTLVLHGAVLDPQEINVYDGELVIIGGSSVQAAADTVHYHFAAFADATIEIVGSTVRDCGRLFNDKGYQAGLYIGTPDAIIEDSVFTSGYGGIFVDGVDITVSACEIHGNDWVGIFVDNAARPTIIDCDIRDNDRWGLVVKNQADATVLTSSIRGNDGGILVDAAYLVADGVDVSNNNVTDLELPHFSQVELFNCSVTATTSYKPVELENSSLVSTNGNFNIAQVDLTSSVFRIQQFLTVKVTWSDEPPSTPIPDVPVTIEDSEGSIFSATTGPDGMAAYLPMLVVEYDKTTPILKTFDYSPFHVSVSYNLQDQDKFVDLKAGSAVVTFQYNDVQDPIAVAPVLRDADVGVSVTLDGSASRDNVAIGKWNWSFEELGQTVYLSGERVDYAFKQAKVYTITLRVYDTSDRSGPSSLATFDVTARDRTPPIAWVGADMTVEQGALVTFDGTNSSDNVAVVSWTWSFTYDGAPRSLIGSMQTWTFAIPGIYPIVLTVEDAAGLTDTASFTVTVEDTTPPTTTTTFDPPIAGDRKFKQIVQVIFTVSGEPAGMVDLFYRVNGGDWEKMPGGLALSFGGDLQYPDGSYEVEYYSKDMSGNAEDVKTIGTFIVDATPPTLTDMDPPISPYTVSKSATTITGRTEVGATLTINNNPVTVGADGTFSYDAILTKGDNNLFLHAEDAVGNTADLTLVIVYQEYDTTTTGDGGNVALYAGVGVIIVIVLVVLIYMFIIKGKGGNPSRAAGSGEWEESR